jgi:AraC family transcriptional regulator
MPQRLSAIKAETPGGGGAFRLQHTTLGIFLVDQPTHRISVGSDKRDHRPLRAREGWIMAAGSEGVCRYDDDHAFLMVEIPDRLMQEVGAAKGFAPQFGAFDPVLVEMALAAPALEAKSLLFRETMERALVAQVAEVISPVGPEMAKLDDPRLRRAAMQIADRLSEDLSLELLANEAGMSAFHFSRAFKAATGQSPLQYVITARMAQAQTLLRTTGLPVAEVAYRVGYEDVSRFGQHFKRHAGATPAAWRKG